jgi:hypothetical protein
MKHTILQNTLVTLGSFIFVITVLNAWTGPSTTPPDPNVSAPLNVSSTGQQKTGGLIVGSLISGGSVQIGNTTTVCAPTIAGAIRWNTGVMEYCNGTVWGPFVGTSSGGSGGNSSPYCAYSGQSHTVNLAINHYINISGSCTVSVDATGYQTFSFSASGAGGSCSRTGNNQDSHPACTYTGFDSGGTGYGVEMSGSFNRDTGVLTCRLTEVGGSSTADSYTFTKDLSKCSTGGSTAETDPTVLASVKDGVSWAEVTGKPTMSSVPSGGVFIMTSCPGGWTRVGNWGTITDQTGIGAITVFQCQAP